MGALTGRCLRAGGIEVSEIFSRTAEMIDEICVIRSMHADVPNHEPSLMLMNCGEARQARPSLGSWVLYGLGTENQNLPGFLVMCPDGFPIAESQNWQAAFLPGIYQGTYVDSRHSDIEKLIAHIRNHGVGPRSQRAQLDLLAELNREHLERHCHEAELEARVQSFELAYRMQSEAAEAFDISHEPAHIREMYGPGDHARQLLATRRLLERGVRCPLWHGAGQPWDHHDDLETGHRELGRQCDQAIGVFLKDLKQRGMLDDTLVVWGGEFGRTPTVELPTPGSNQGKMNGRDHNHYGFTTWLAGGGVKGGTVHGATDELGFQAVEKPVHVHDLHATILHLLGFNHQQFTSRYAGRLPPDRRPRQGGERHRGLKRYLSPSFIHWIVESSLNKSRLCRASQSAHATSLSAGGAAVPGLLRGRGWSWSASRRAWSANTWSAWASRRRSGISTWRRYAASSTGWYNGMS